MRCAMCGGLDRPGMFAGRCGSCHGEAARQAYYAKQERIARLFRRLMNALQLAGPRGFWASGLIERWRGVLRRRHGWVV
jgi:hypothetical protein